ncbi:sterol desaturase family protein [Lysobacter sp. A3-1-A15]
MTPRRHPWIETLTHPVLLVGALAVWWVLDRSEEAALVALIATQAVLAILEARAPAMPHWRQTLRQKLGLAAVYLATLVVLGLVLSLYGWLLAPPLAQARDAWGLALWPNGWPLLAQVVLLYFASEFIYYWIHRAIHGSGVFWRISGHGFHHAYQNMHALNAGATHPLEVLFLALPALLITALLGGGAEAAAGATTLLVVNASIVHANVHTDTPGLRWLVTSSAHHRRHHSSVFDDSNSNYSCNAIVWDRLFGTYSAGPVAQTGIGPHEPTFMQKLLLPLREPVYADTAAARDHPTQRDT